MRLALSVVVFATMLLGCVHSSGTATEIFWPTQLTENEPQNFAKVGPISGDGFYLSWKVTWNLITTGQVLLGPYWVYLNDSQIVSRFNEVNVTGQIRQQISSNGTVSQTLDPCTYYMITPDLYESYSLSAYNTTGWVNVTQYRDYVPTFGGADSSATITLDCPIECKKYVHLSISTSLQSYVTVLNITSRVSGYLHYTEDPSQCPTNGTGYSVINAGSNIINVKNQTEIWLLFYGYEPTNSPQDNVLIEWSVVPYNGSPTPQSTPVSITPINAPEYVPLSAPENAPIGAPQSSVPYKIPVSNTPYNVPQNLSPHSAPNSVITPESHTPHTNDNVDYFFWGVVLGGVCLGVVLIIIVVVVVVRRRKRTQFLYIN